MIGSTRTSRRRIRLIDIAREAEVSPAAVGFVLNGTGQGVITVGEDKRQRILAVAQRLGYQPNRLAQTLAGKQSRIIGVIIDSSLTVKHHWLMAMEQIAVQAGYRFMIGQSHDSLEQVAAYSADFAAWGVDGILCLSHDYPHFGHQIVQVLGQHRHVVYIDPPLKDPQQHCFVTSDAYAGMYAATEDLIRAGRRRVGLIHHDLVYNVVRQRHRGYLAAMEAADRDPAGLVHALDYRCSAEQMRPVLAALLDAGCDGLVTTYDHLGALATNLLHHLGRRVPEDIAIFGWDNTDMVHLAVPPLSSVDVNGPAIAQAAVAMLLKLIAGETLAPAEKHIHITPTLVRRGSTGHA